MHEANFTENIVQTILDELRKAPPGQARRARVVVGEMLHLNADSVRMHFEQMSLGTPLEGVALELVEEPVRLRCLNCGWSGEAEDHHLLFCSSCSSIAVDVLSGRDVIIDEVEVEATPA